MTMLQLIRFSIVAVTCLGLVLPGPLAWAAMPADSQSTATKAPSPVELVSDVELDTDGALRGAVIDMQGVPVAKVTVLVYQGNREVARTKTDSVGYFVVDGLRSGTYLVSADSGRRLYRVWTPRSAPPKTGQLALVVVGNQVVRGQRPLGDCFNCDAVLLTGLVAAVIAIPIAVYNSDDSPASP